MPWQQQVVDVAGEVDPATGLLWYRQVIITVMRQQGKTTLQLPVMVDRCLSWPTAQHVTYAAQSGVAARDKLFDEHWPVIERSPLRKAVKIRRTSGHEALLWRNGSRHTLTAGKETSGHGMTLDGAVIDEAFAYQDSRLEQAFIPAMQTRPDPQLLITSTAGYDEFRSPYLWSKVRLGRELVESADPTSRVAYFEWSFDPADDPFAESTWLRRMPAVGLTTPLSAVRAAADGMDQPEFLRAFGNLWGQTGSGAPIEVAVWTGLRDQTSQVVGPVTLGVAVSDDGSSWSCIGVAGARADGVLHVELVDNRRGTGWVVAELDRLAKAHGATVVVGKATAAGGLIADLEARGVPLRQVGGSEVAQASVKFAAAVREGALRHIGQPAVDMSVERARVRATGDLWRFAGATGTDISPLNALVLAAWGSGQTATPPAPVFVW